MAESSSGLFKLPAELRNNVYDYCFAPQHKLEEIDLLAAKPPAKTPLLVCRQFYTEARGIYQSAYRCYWTENHFMAKVSLPGRRYTKDDIIALSAKDVNQIRHLELRLGDAENKYGYQLIDASGAWLYKARLSEPDEVKYYVMISRIQWDERNWRLNISRAPDDRLLAWESFKSKAYASMRHQICALLGFHVWLIPNECE